MGDSQLEDLEFYQPSLSFEKIYSIILVSSAMFTRTSIISLTLIASAFARKGNQVDERMDSVVPENLIPPSPVLPVGDALKTFQLAPGFVIESVAAEPLVDTPVCLDFDSSGRMWICEMRGYMPDIDGKGESVPEGRIVILEDTNQDGKADKRTVFLEKILLPRAVSVFEDGVLFIDEKQLYWVNRKGDSPVGEPTVIPTNIVKVGNVEHKPNGLLANLDNCYYLAKSDKRLRRVGEGWEFETTTFRGQWGIARDDYGHLFHNNNSTLLFGDLLAPNLLQGNPNVRMRVKDYVQLGNNQVWPARVTPAVNRAYQSKANGYKSDTLDPLTYKLKETTAAAGMTIYRGTNFPSEWYGTAFVGEPVANLLKAIRIKENDGKLTGMPHTEKSEFLTSTDERFRPVNAYNAPDGSLYILDMYHGIIQHETYMSPYLRAQTLSRGLESPSFGNGRIYRIRSVTGTIQHHAVNLSSLHGADLVDLLKHPNAWHREAAQRLLVQRKNPGDVSFLTNLADEGTTLARIHAIWTLEGMGVLKAKNLSNAIQSSDAKLQASALWACTRLPDAECSKLESLMTSVQLASPEVAPYLARALGPLGTPAAFARLAVLLTNSDRKYFVREAVVSGLGHNETEFLEAQMKDSKDRELRGWLEQGSQEKSADRNAAPTLTGAELESFQRGKTMFHGEAACFGCHSADGAGMPNLGPPLDDSEWVKGTPETLVRILLSGLTGPVTVTGENYKPAADMPGLGMNPAMTDQDLADLMTYIRNEWSNTAPAVSADLVKRQRDLTKDRGSKPWTVEELAK